MEGSHTLKLLAAAMISVSPLIAGAQDAITTGSSLTISGATLSLGNFNPVTPVQVGGLTNSLSIGTLNIVPIGGIDLASGSTGIFAQSVGGGGNVGISLPIPPIALLPGTPLTVAQGTNDYSFGAATGGTSSGLTMDQLHGHLINGEFTGSSGFEAIAPASPGSPILEITTVPEPGVSALLILSGVSSAARLLRKRR